MRKVLLVMALCLLPPGMAQAATERDASVGFCEGCSSPTNVVLDLTIDPGGNWKARAEHLTLQDGQWQGTGTLDYEGQGISVHERAAHFSVIFERGPSVNPDCARVSKFPASIVISGVNGSLASTDRQYDTSLTCPRATYTVTIEGPRSFRKRFQTADKKPLRERVTVTGRMLQP